MNYLVFSYKEIPFAINPSILRDLRRYEFPAIIHVEGDVVNGYASLKNPPDFLEAFYPNPTPINGIDHYINL